MKIRQPLVLLLGGLLSASSVGCAAVSAVVAEYQPGGREPHQSAERLVAIGRVFENQGRLDQAEAMYRRALKSKPNDPTIQDQVRRLADARNGRHFESDSVASALAAADAVTPGRKSGGSEVPPTSGRATVKAESSEIGSKIGIEPVSLSTENKSLAVVAPEVTDEPFESSEPSESLTESVNDAASATPVCNVTVPQVLAVMDQPNANADLLISGLSSSDPEVRCLCAMVLGDCDPSSASVREALCIAEADTRDERFVLNVAAARNLRGESDAMTAERLIGLLESTDVDIPVQAASELRFFAGTDCDEACVTALAAQLAHTDSRVRTVAAASLGDFQSLDADTLSQLQDLASDDISVDVREAATSTIGREVAESGEGLPELTVEPRS